MAYHNPFCPPALFGQAQLFERSFLDPEPAQSEHILECGLFPIRTAADFLVEEFAAVLEVSE